MICHLCEEEGYHPNVDVCISNLRTEIEKYGVVIQTIRKPQRLSVFAACVKLGVPYKYLWELSNELDIKPQRDGKNKYYTKEQVDILNKYVDKKYRKSA